MSIEASLVEMVQIIFYTVSPLVKLGSDESFYNQIEVERLLF